jgi:hypothetical protein
MNPSVPPVDDSVGIDKALDTLLQERAANLAAKQKITSEIMDPTERSNALAELTLAVSKACTTAILSTERDPRFRGLHWTFSPELTAPVYAPSSLVCRLCRANPPEAGDDLCTACNID